MNRIFKVIKNRSTGLYTVTSELAKGAKKGSTAAGSVLLLSLISSGAYAVGVPQGYTPAVNDNQVGKVTISSSGNLDLGEGQGFASAQKGQEVKKYVLKSDNSVTELYNIKYKAVADAQGAVNTKQGLFDQAQNRYNQLQSSTTATDQEKEQARLAMQTAQNELNSAKGDLQTAQTKAAEIPDSKFKVEDPNGLLSSRTAGVRAAPEERWRYRDIITGQQIQLEVIKELQEIDNSTAIQGGGLEFTFYEKMPSENQYENIKMVDVNGAGTTVNVVNTGSADKANLTAITKGGGVIDVNDGANLNYNTNTNYYTGSGASISLPFEEKPVYTSQASTTLYGVTYKGTVDSIIGTRTINSLADFNNFNRDLKRFLQNDEQIRLDYPTKEKMQALYNAEIAKAYSTDKKGTYTITYNVNRDEVDAIAEKSGQKAQFDNRVTEQDTNDIGLKGTGGNYFIGVKGSGSTITVAEGATISHSVNGNTSSGVVIKGDFDTSAQTAQNTYNINGKVAGNNANTQDSSSTSTVRVKNAVVNVASSAEINGAVVITGSDVAKANKLTNDGKITGNTYMQNGSIVNNKEMGSITGNNVKIDNNTGAKVGNIDVGDNSQITNDGALSGSIRAGKGSTVVNKANSTVGGSVVVQDGSSIQNDANAVIKGVVIANGGSASFNNEGTINGSINAVGGATGTNAATLVSKGTNDVVKLESGSKATNTGHIYIGYEQNPADATTDPNKIVVSNTADNYTAINVTGKKDDANPSTFMTDGNSKIYLAGNQTRAVAVGVSQGGKYTASETAEIVLNNEDLVPVSGEPAAGSNEVKLDKELGNANTAVLVKDEGSTADIKGKITLKDSGSTAVKVQNGADVVFSGTVNLDGKNVDSDAMTSIGLHSENEGSTLTMNGNAVVNINSDRGIGVHVRDQGRVVVNDNAGITFGDKEKQIGFLISGITANAGSPPAIEYNSTKDMALQGKGSVLMRIERGSKFDSNTIGGTRPPSVFDSNNTEDSTLMLITSGVVASPAVDNWQTKADLSNFTLKVSGKGAKGVAVQGGANASITTSTTLSVAGDGATLAEIDGKYYDLNGKETHNSLHNTHVGRKSILNSEAVLNAASFAATNSVGYLVKNGGELHHSGTVDFTANSNNNIGVKVVDGGKVINNAGSAIKVQGTAIEVSGSASEVEINSTEANTPIVWAVGTGNADNPGSAYHLKDKANLTLTGVGVTKAEGNAHAILVDGASRVFIDSSVIDVLGTGNGIENRSSLNNIQFTNNATINVADGIGIHSGVGFSSPQKTKGVINVTGSGTGIKFEKIDPTNGASAGNTDVAIQNTGFENVVINVKAQDGKGIDVYSTKDVLTSASVNIMDSNGNAALIVNGTSQNVTQRGNLQSTSSNPIVSLSDNVKNFTNEGKLLSGSFDTDGNFTATKDETKFALKQQADRIALNFTNRGEINNTVELLGKNADGSGNVVTLANGSKGELFKTGDGRDTFNINRVTGTDTDGVTKQFAKLDGGAEADNVWFGESSNFAINNTDTIKNIELVGLRNGSTLTLNNLPTMLNGTEEYNISDAASTLVYNKDSTANVDAKLTGNGTFLFNGDVVNNTDRKDLNFTGSRHTGGTFAGTVEIKNANLNLEGTNTDALTKAELKVSGNSEVEVQAGEQAMRKLNFNGGVVDFNNVTLTDPVSKSANHVSVTDLHLGSGKVRVDLATPSAMANSKPLMEQDDAGMMSKLASSVNAVTGSVDNVTLVDKNGDVIPSAIKTDINQDGVNQVARVSYESKLTTEGEAGNGLYLRYGIDTVELKEKEANGLKLDGSGKTGLAAELKAKVTDFNNDDGTKTEGDLQIVGNSEVTLNNTANDYHGKTLVKDTATLKAGSDNALGNTKELNLAANTGFDLNGKTQTVGALNTATDSTADLKGGNLTIAGLENSTVNGTLKGAGNLTVNDNTLTVNGSNTDLTAKVTVGADDTKAAKVDANQIDSLGTGEINIKEEAEVNVTLEQAVGSAVEIANKLTGTGEYNFTGKNQTEIGFKAGTNVGGTFEGEVELSDAKLSLAADNTDALTNATLKASDKALVNVGNNTQTIKALDFNGGTVNFQGVGLKQVDPVALAAHNIAVTDLNLGSGKVQVDIAPSNGLVGGLSLLEQDNDSMKARLIKSTNDIVGDAANLTLVDKNGAALPDPTKQMISQDGQDVARASYGTELSVSGDKKGLDLSMGITKVELKAQGDNALKLDATGKSNKDAELVVQVTDFDNDDGTTKTEGDLQIVGSGTVTLNNATNDYHGKTLVKDTATLKAGSDNALGNTKELNLAANTGFDLNGKTQTVGALNTAADSTTDLKGGNLTIAGLENSTVNGTLKGAGDLTVNDKTVTVNGSNADLTAKVTVGADDTKAATVNANKVDSLGTGEINIKEKAEVNVTLEQTVGSAVEIANKLTGSGQYNFNGDKTNAGQTEVAFKAGSNTGGTFEGEVELTNAKFNLAGDNTDALTNAELKASNNSLVNVGEGAQTIDTLTFNGGTVNFGDVNVSQADPIQLANNHIKVTDLNLDTGNVQIGVGAPKNNAGGSLSLMEQDNDAMKARLIQSENDINGTTANIKLIDKDGNVLPSPTKMMIEQNGEDVARASYGNNLSVSTDKKGLDLELGLTKVELKAQGDNALKLDATGKSNKDAELVVQVTDFDNGDGTKTEGDLQIVGSGEVTLNNTANDYHGKTLVKDTATLKAGSNNALGNTKELNLAANTGFDLNGKTQTVGALNTAADSTTDLKGGNLTIAGLENSTVNGTLEGAGNLTVNDKTLTVNGSNADLTAKVTVGADDTKAATVNANKVDSLGTGEINIKEKAEVNVTLEQAVGSAVEIANKLTGSGQYNFNGDKTNAGQTEVAFKAGSNTGGTFEGEVELTNAKFNLAGDNTDALTKATLKVSDNAVVNVGDKQAKAVGAEVAQAIDALTLNGGLLDFGSVNLGTTNVPKRADNNIVVDTLKVESDSKVHVDVAQDTDTGLVAGIPLLQQDDSSAMKARLITAVNIDGVAVDDEGRVTNIKVVDENGNETGGTAKVDLKQNAEEVARAIYDAKLTKDNDGLNIEHKLKEVQLKVTGDNALKLDSSTATTDKARELTAKITDFVNDDNSETAGDLQIVGTGTVTLTNENNDYHGKTLVKDTAVLKAGSNNALGNTKELNLAAGTTFDLNGKTQTVGALNTTGSAAMPTALGGGNSMVDINGGTLIISGISDSVVSGRLRGNGSLLLNDGNLTVKSFNTGLSADVVIGNDDVTKATVNVAKLDSLGTGTVKLNNDAVLNVTVNTDGSLTNAVITSDSSDTQGQLNKTGAAMLTMTADQAQYYGETNLNEGTLVLEGTAETVKSTQVNVKADTVLAAVNNVVLAGQVNNSGTFHVGHLPSSTDFTASATVGGYQGLTDSKLVFNGNLGGDNSPFNTLKVTGNTSGSSVINVNNIAGTGEETKDGIKIIEVAGDSDAKFTLSDRLSAGAYDYRLIQKAKDWYLSSKGGLKPEVGSYLSNLVAANTMFDLRLHDRLGEPAFTNNYLEKGKWPSVWAKARYDYSKFGDDRGQLSNKLHNRTIQLGADIARWGDDNENLYLVGLMGGYGVSNSKTQNPVTGYESKGKLTGFNWGVYATMYANNKDQTGFHADTWVLWNEFKGTVSGSKSTNKYDLSGVLASLELGYTTKFEGEGEYNYFLQPKAQFTYSGVNALESQEGGAWVSGKGENLRTRLGLKAFMNNKSPNAEKVWQPFVELNWLHNVKPYTVALGATEVKQGGVKDIGEVKLGLERKSSKNVDFWMNASYQFGRQGFNNTSVQAGIKYSF